MSHEIRTPLNDMIDILEMTSLNDRQRHYVAIIKTVPGGYLTLFPMV